MNLFPYILGPVWVLDVTLTSDGHTIAAWRCKMGCEPQQTVYDAAAVAKGVAVVTVSGHGTIVKPADSQLDAGLSCMIGKGVRNQNVQDAMERNGAVYMVAIGGAGAAKAASIKKVEVIAYDELGCESVKRLTVENFSAIVSQDSAGGSCSARRPRVRRWRRPSCGGRHCQCWDFFFACWQPIPPSPRR